MGKEKFEELIKAAVDRSFPDEQIVWNGPLYALVGGVSMIVSEEEYLNNMEPHQANDLISAHVADIKRRLAA